MPIMMMRAPDIDKSFGWEPESRRVFRIGPPHELLMDNVKTAEMAHLLVNMWTAGYRSRKRELKRDAGTKHRHMFLEMGKIVDALRGDQLAGDGVAFAGYAGRFEMSAADIGFAFSLRADGTLHVTTFAERNNYEQIAAGVHSDAVAATLSEAWCMGYRHHKREEN